MNPAEEAGARPRRIGVLVAVAAAALAIDAISKVIVVALLQDRPPTELLDGLLTLRVLRNSGAAFNIGNGMTYVFTVIATGVVVAILRYARRLRSLPWAVTLGLLLGGALGNLVDRMLRSPGPLRGHVVDWIELPHWPVFNLADSAIVCGGALAVLLASRGLQVDGTVYRNDSEKDDPAGRDVRPGDGEGGSGGAGDQTAAHGEAEAGDNAAGDARNGEGGAPPVPGGPSSPGASRARGAAAGGASPGEQAASGEDARGVGDDSSVTDAKH